MVIVALKPSVNLLDVYLYILLHTYNSYKVVIETVVKGQPESNGPVFLLYF